MLRAGAPEGIYCGTDLGDGSWEIGVGTVQNCRVESGSTEREVIECNVEEPVVVLGDLDRCGDASGDGAAIRDG